MNNKLIIYGLGSHAEMVYSFFRDDSDYDVKAFTVEKKYVKSDFLFDIPVVPYEDIETKYPPNIADMFVAIGPQKLNQIREQYYLDARKKGYQMASYCSSKSRMWSDLVLNNNCLIDNGSQAHPFVKVGNNVVVISSDIGHHSIINDHAFISSSIIGGNVIVEENVFIGIGSSINSGVRIGKGSIIGMGSIINEDVAPYSVYAPKTTQKRNIDARRIQLFKKRD